MEDVFHLSNNNTQYFYNTGSNAWQVWRKNPIASTVVIFCLGGGGAGAGGESQAFGNTKNGGGGGGSAAYVTATYPACLLPDELYINVASGGTSGDPNTAGGSGSLSYVSIKSNSKLPQDCICVSGTGGAESGAGCSLVTGGIGGSVVTTSMAYFLKLSTFYAVSGLTGAAGTLNGVGTSVNALTSNITTPGAGGGGAGGGTAGFLGGSVNGQGLCNYVIMGGSAFTDANGTNGGDGIFVDKPFCTFSGAGGGGTGQRIGGNGGNASFGSGGGGGGGGGTGGYGGKGGDSLVIIVQI